MVRIAIINHSSHTLYVEDISDADLQKYGDEQSYINDNYTFDGEYSWDYIVDAQYFPRGGDYPLDIDFDEIADI